MGATARRKLLVPDGRLILPRGFDRRRIARPAPWIWVPKRFAPWMAVAFDTSGTANNGGSAVLTFSSNFTIGSSLVNGAILGFLAVGSGAQIVSPTMTWNSVSMGLISNTSAFDAGAASICLFGLVNPAGGTHSLSASWSTNSGGVTLGFWSFSGVDQTGGATTFINGANDTNGAATASHTSTITTVSGNATVLGWDVGQVYSGTQTPTQDWQQTTNGIPFSEGQHILSTSTSDSYTATITAADSMINCGCSIKAAAGAATAVVDKPRRRYLYR